MQQHEREPIHETQRNIRQQLIDHLVSSTQGYRYRYLRNHCNKKKHLVISWLRDMPEKQVNEFFSELWFDDNKLYNELHQEIYDKQNGGSNARSVETA